MFFVEALWLDSRMPDSRSREPGHESPKHIGAVDGDSLWHKKIKSLYVLEWYLAIKCDLFINLI